jgi:hypothetical protein
MNVLCYYIPTNECTTDTDYYIIIAATVTATIHILMIIGMRLKAEPVRQ